MKTIKQEWEEFKQRVVPPQASSVQKQEMRRAYYAGAWTMLMLTKELGNEEYTEESAVKILEKFENERILQTLSEQQPEVWCMWSSSQQKIDRTI